MPKWFKSHRHIWSGPLFKFFILNPLNKAGKHVKKFIISIAMILIATRRSLLYERGYVFSLLLPENMFTYEILITFWIFIQSFIQLLENCTPLPLKPQNSTKNSTKHQAESNFPFNLRLMSPDNLFTRKEVFVCELRFVRAFYSKCNRIGSAFMNTFYVFLVSSLFKVLRRFEMPGNSKGKFNVSLKYHRLNSEFQILFI